MRTTINIEKARELGFPIPDGAPGMILYEIEPADTTSPGQPKAADEDAAELADIRKTLGLDDDDGESAHSVVCRFLGVYKANTQEAGGLRNQIEGYKLSLSRQEAGLQESARQLAELRAQLDSEQALRKQVEQELEDALAKLTEPPAKPAPEPATPVAPPVQAPKPEEPKGAKQLGRKANG